MIHARCGASARVLSPPSAPEDEEEEEEESPAGELETVEVTLGTLDLREFEVMPKRNRKRRKKRNKKVENGEGEELCLGRRLGCGPFPHPSLPVQGLTPKRRDAPIPRVGSQAWSWWQSCRKRLGLSPFPGLEVSGVWSWAPAPCAGAFAAAGRKSCHSGCQRGCSAATWLRMSSVSRAVTGRAVSAGIDTI